MKSFNWVFRDFISKKSPYALASRLGKSEKLILTYALEVLKIINFHAPELAFRALQEIANELGYRLEPHPKEGEVPFHKILKELNDVEEALVDETNSIEEDIKEIEEALHVLLQKKAELKRKLEHKRR